MKKNFIFAIILFLYSGTILFAFPFEPDSSRLQFTLPDKWTVEETKGEAMAFTPDAEMGIDFILYDTDDFDKAYQKIFNELEGDYDNFEMSSLEEMKINGMQAAKCYGTGTNKNISCTMELCFFETPAGKILLAYALGEVKITAKYKKDIAKIFKSVKKL